MALSHYVTYAATTTGTQASVNVDPSISPFNLSVGVFVVTGAASYGIQFSLDPQETSDAASRWFNDPAFPSGITVSQVAVYNNPITKIRLVIVTNAGGIELKTLQGFTQN